MGTDALFHIIQGAGTAGIVWYKRTDTTLWEAIGTGDQVTVSANTMGNIYLMVQVPGVGVGNLTIKAIPCADDGGSEDRFKKADSSSSEIVLYPNPTDALVTIKGLSETDQVMVCDVSGKVYQTQIGKPDLKLDVSLLLSGVYIVAIQQKNNIKHFKFIKNAKN